MRHRPFLLPAPLMQSLGWIMVGLCALLGVLGVGSLILQLLGRRYRDLAVYVACGAFTGLCVIVPLYLSARQASHWGGFLWGVFLWLLLSATIWCFCAWSFLWNYNGERKSDDWYAPPDKIVFNNGFLLRTHIVVYEPGNLLWTGAMLPEYEYID